MTFQGHSRSILSVSREGRWGTYQLVTISCSFWSLHCRLKAASSLRNSHTL